MPGWNFADVWEAVADALPGAPAQVQGHRRVTWNEFDRRADGIARTLLDAGVQRQDKVAQYLHNCPEYLESMFGIFKASLAPVNTNYRYTEDELVYLWDNADAVACVFQGTYAARVEPLRARVPRIRTWIWVDDGSGPCPDWAVPYEQAAASATERVQAPWGRDGDDLYVLYTGGTTGMPKGVMWRQDDLVALLNEGNGKRAWPEPAAGAEPDLDVIRQRLPAMGPGPVNLPACPLMHGTGAFNAFTVMVMGGCIVTLASTHFNADELLDTIEREGVNSVSIVGDAFAKPILRALDAAPNRWDISPLKILFSSGVMWSAETKRGLLRHNPKLLLVDSFGSSEAVGMATSVSTGDAAVQTAKFTISDRTRVLTEDGREVEPGSGEVGMVARKGRAAVGYYKDEEKSASTFRVVDGVRYSIPGDFAAVEADGTITLLGRGSVCINTGGEKVFPEEVEEVLKTHPTVRDAVVVGLPDERFG